MSSSSTGSTASWHYLTASILAGVGLGYLIGVISARWLWRERERRPQQESSTTGGSGASLVTALGQLTTEMGRLREAMTVGGQTLSRPPVPRSVGRTDSTAEFVSAYEESEGSADEDFYDVTSPSVEEISIYSTLDALGERTLESEEVCVSLIEQIKSRLDQTPNDVGLLWRLARVLVHLSMHHQNREEKERERELLEEATEHAQKGVEMDDKVAQAHQWYAVAVGAVSKFEGTQQKITKGHIYKEHIDIAISLTPDKPTLHYLLGRWCLEVAALSWLEKKAAAALYATPPESTYEEALQCFMKAEALNPGKWKSNMLFIAKCHIQLVDISEAVQWLQRAYDLPSLTTEDTTAQSEIHDLLIKYDENFSE